MRSTRTLTITAWLICASVPAVAQDADLPAGRIVGEGQMQVGRYTTTVAAPPETTARPLDVYVQLSYPRQTVQTVGDAVRHTLLRTGWRLVEPSALAPQAAHLLNLPLRASKLLVSVGIDLRPRNLMAVLFVDDLAIGHVGAAVRISTVRLCHRLRDIDRRCR